MVLQADVHKYTGEPTKKLRILLKSNHYLHENYLFKKGVYIENNINTQNIKFVTGN